MSEARTTFEFTQGELISRMTEIRDQRRDLAKEDRLLSHEFHQLEESLLASMDNIGLTQVGSGDAVASITEQQIGNVQDWDRYHSWLRKTNRLYMLERRVAQAAFREYVEQSRGHKPPPGVVVFTKRTISLRKKK